jgi:NAD(P)-dependent dehydrogenase (short-subunit alcohol dehydrogenase family)
MAVWFITGASRGLGRQWAIAALDRGDQVAAAARDTAALADLRDTYGAAILPIRLDVTDREECFAGVRSAHDRFGRLDVVVNNAGYGQYGFVEELSEADARAQMDTNFFGALWVTQAALPILRAQRSGHLIQVSSIGGVTAFPNLGIYHASKWALEGLTQSLAGEVRQFGINVTLVEPGGFATDWVGAAAESRPIDAYNGERARFESARLSRMSDLAPPAASRSAILTIVDAAEPPLRVFLGENVFALARSDYEARLAEWELWQPVAAEAHGRIGVSTGPDAGR